MQRILSTMVIVSTLLVSSIALAAGVSRAQFTTEIADREPIDLVEALSTDQTQVLFFSELSDLQGQTVTHQWVYNDSIMFEKSFEVGGSRWRVWTSKTLQPGWTGTWIVNILDGERNVLLTKSFDYQ